MDNSAEICIALINEGLRQKFSYLQELYDLTVKQTAAIKAEDVAELNRLVDKKQVKINAVDMLDEDFKKNFQNLKNILGVTSLDGLDAGRIPGAIELKQLVADILSMIKKLSDLETANSTGVNKLLATLGNEVKKLNQGIKINNAYAPTSYNRFSYFIDKKK